MRKRILITGRSEYGKSHYAQKMVSDYLKKGLKGVVYSSTYSDPWEGCELHRDIDSFLKRVWELTTLAEKLDKPVPVVIVVDEADEVLNQYMRENHWLLKKGRHFFPVIIVLTQRPKMVAPTVRGQCNELIAFSLHKDDATELGRDFVADLSMLPEFMQGEYMHVYIQDRKLMVDKHNAFDQ